MDQAGTPPQAAQADNALTQTLRTLFAVAENYPQLKANENFLQLQRDLSDIERYFPEWREEMRRKFT